MILEEYKAAQKRLYNEYIIEKNKLYKEYAYSNKVFNKGDILKSGNVIILVDRISVTVFNDIPRAVYLGQRLTKKLERYNSNERDSIYESEIKDIFKLN